MRDEVGSHSRKKVPVSTGNSVRADPSGALVTTREDAPWSAELELRPRDGATVRRPHGLAGLDVDPTARCQRRSRHCPSGPSVTMLPSSFSTRRRSPVIGWGKAAREGSAPDGPSGALPVQRGRRAPPIAMSAARATQPHRRSVRPKGDTTGPSNLVRRRLPGAVASAADSRSAPRRRSARPVPPESRRR